MKHLARTILQTIINNLPENRQEYAKAMLAELEELEGWKALVWATGGIPLWLEQGAIMKLVAFWLGITGLYIALKFSLHTSIFMATFEVIAFVALRRSSIFACRKPA